MMEVELTTWLMLRHVVDYAPEAEVVSRRPNGEIHRSTYAEVGRRSQQLMHALDRLGLDEGDRVATLAWNGSRHLEAYFGIPSSGRVLHTLNARLSPDELIYIIGHAGDRAILVDADLLPLIEEVADRVPSLQHVIVLDDSVPDTTLSGVLSYEDLLADEATTYPERAIAERTPLGLCYTSGTTGRPKGALYTHRSTYLHALTGASMAGMAIGPGDAVLPQVPMFHASAWGMPYAAALMGAKQVYFAGALDGRAFVELLAAERVTVTAGVPTVWMAVGDALEDLGIRLPDLRHIICGGAQPPRSLISRFADQFGIRIIQAWGMTETSPLASVAWPQERMRGWDDAAVTEAARVQAGIPLPGIEIAIRDDEGADLPFDGAAMGDLYVRGPWVIDGYFDGAGEDAAHTTAEEADPGATQWFHTGDVAIGSPGGYFVIADRSKDLIKSGGEWISSVDMEAAIMAMDDVEEAAVIAVFDPKWQERPLACIVPRPGRTVSPESVRAQLESRGFARWQLPERVEVIDEVPKTSVGKFDKKVLRTRFAT